MADPKRCACRKRPRRWCIIHYPGTLAQMLIYRGKTPPRHDPTHGRIDFDIQDQVEAMKPTSLGSRVAMENTLQERRDRG